MNSSFYDVIVLGTRLGALLTGALLAKRGFRVLFLDQNDLPASYSIGPLQLPRNPFSFLPSQTPIVRDVLGELALYQIVKRKLSPRDPSFQVCLPNHRFELSLRPEIFEREIVREFPEVKRPVEDLHRNITLASEAFDKVTELNIIWPPEGFFERRDLNRAIADYPFLTGAAEHWDLLSEFAEDHIFRHIVHSPVRFATGLDPNQLSGLGIARPYAQWMQGMTDLDGGYTWFEKMITDRITIYSGEIRAKESIDRIKVERNKIKGVRIAGTSEEIGCNFLVAGCHVAELSRLLPDSSPFEEIFERIGEPQPRWFRFTVNFVIDSQGIPEGMVKNVFLVTDPERARAAENIYHIEINQPNEQKNCVICVQTLLPRRSIEDVSGYMDNARTRIHEAVRTLIPFLDEHLLWVDSPHDGLDLLDYKTKRTISSDEPWLRGPQTMDPVFGYPVRGTLGVCAMPSRVPIKHLFLCNDQVIPGLGLEGLFLAASSVARLITRADRKKEWMRRGAWTKVEL